MQTACLYIRVSTDEQALKGYSKYNRKEQLYQFCKMNGLLVRACIFEDYSAKTFNRPEWIKLLKTFNANKAGRPDVVLFTRWDRFSRNSADAYYMISLLKKINIQVQAIEQPLDLTVPENKMILALFLAISEVENDRRALNIKRGIHKAKQEGRWTGHSPKGYINKTSHDERKYIAPCEPEPGIIEKIFLELSKGTINISSSYRYALSLGLKCSKNNFWCLVRNPVYCGKIKVPAFEKEKSYLVNGSHERLVSEDLFNDVQRQLLRLSRKHSVRKEHDSNFPLRGILQCPCCKKSSQVVFQKDAIMLMPIITVQMGAITV